MKDPQTFVQEAIDGFTQRIDAVKCKEAVQRMYRLFTSSDKPSVTVLGGPIAVAQHSHKTDNKNKPYETEILRWLNNQDVKLRRGALDKQEHSNVYSTVRDLIKPVNDYTIEILGTMAHSFIPSILMKAELARCKYALEKGLIAKDDDTETFLSWIENCPLAVSYQRSVLVADNPTKIRYNIDRQLHNLEGPAIQYADGFGVFCIQGILVDEQIVLRPETQTIDQIDNEPNADKRAIRIAQLGWPTYLRRSNAKELDSVHNDIEGTEEAIYKVKGGHRFAAVCPTGRIFVMNIPDTLTKCANVREWLNPFTHETLNQFLLPKFKVRIIGRT